MYLRALSSAPNNQYQHLLPLPACAQLRLVSILLRVFILDIVSAHYYFVPDTKM